MEEKELERLLSQYFEQNSSELKDAQKENILNKLMAQRQKSGSLEKVQIWIAAASVILLIAVNIAVINHFEHRKPDRKVNPVYSEYLSQFNQM
ncbi:MAG: hypothetical protein WAS56_10770 [Saprospiraceae bacterium]|nr:hypothetical protein [Saprospiraceae bacterium]MBK9993784.1 hypothetical protein [Saprospiraceae bacterium]